MSAMDVDASASTSADVKPVIKKKPEGGKKGGKGAGSGKKFEVKKVSFSLLFCTASMVGDSWVG